MSNIGEALRRILVAVDGRSVRDKALQQAIYLARSLGSELYVIIVRQRQPWYEVLAMDVSFPRPDIEANIEETKHQALRLAAESGVALSSIVVAKGRPAAEIVRHSKKLGCDLTVVGQRTRSLKRLRTSHTVREVVSRSPCPVLVVPV
ncbi:universal stress protein [Rubrobacter taiwanensis]|uniref:Universal stress protein n=1 Tax=Rubrobacter taiwanensis TaxID=185139 RepID=A0A4R1BRD5_9ACTN|nr:universal stress protein [Rubrobacter taiwanensis]